jgi:hypothetical protein
LALADVALYLGHQHQDTGQKHEEQLQREAWEKALEELADPGAAMKQAVAG